jgi:hypothetical protein
LAIAGFDSGGENRSTGGQCKNGERSSAEKQEHRISILV